MVAITSLGIGSGADLSSLVNQLVAVERQPLNQMRSAATGLQTQVSSYGKLSSQLSSLQTAANKLNNASLWTQSTARSSDESAVSVVGSSNAGSGNFSVSVSRLATSQTVVSGSPLSAANTPVGSGTLTLELGRWQPPAPVADGLPQPPMNFVPQVGRSVSIEVTGSDDLSSLRDKINGANAGVTASLVTDSSGVRLALRSTATGAENGFRIQASDDDGTPVNAEGLSRFAYDPEQFTTAMESRQEAGNAAALVNGIAISSASNELSGVVEGMTFRLRKENFGSADITVNSDRDGVKTAIQAFADSYNELARTIADQTRYDPTSRQGGPLQGDSAVGSLQRQLRGLINSGSGASSVFSRLSDVGLQLQRDGTLQVNTTKLDAALNNPQELRKAFSNTGSGDSANAGFARRYADLASRALGTEGTLTTRTQSLQKMLAKNSDEQARLSDRVDRVEKRLVAQYTALDTNLARLNALQSSLTQQLNNLNRTNNNR
jgi:flagellar hook-associated protein 2